MKKYFIITIDTESDNQWSKDSVLSTENAKYIPRFQELCEKYSFKPVYLTDYSMANDDYYISYIKEKQNSGLCEVGMHLHAWDTPPFCTQDNNAVNKPYLIEYPEEQMYEKIATLTDLLEHKLGVKITSHRAGRWATDDRYFKILEQLGYTVDCSVTPGIDWSMNLGCKNGGSNYSDSCATPFFLTENRQLLEVPMTIRNIHTPIVLKQQNIKNILRSVKHHLIGKDVWIRPSVSSNEEMKAILKLLQKEESSNYAEFMMHSSEFMPGGSPYFITSDDIDRMFLALEAFFDYIQESYQGITMRDFYKEYIAE